MEGCVKFLQGFAAAEAVRATVINFQNICSFSVSTVMAGDVKRQSWSEVSHSQLMAASRRVDMTDVDLFGLDATAHLSIFINTTQCECRYPM